MTIRNLIFAAVCFGVAWAGAAEAFVVNASAVQDSEIRLDGVLDEAVWQAAVRHGGFTRFRHPEKPAAEQTSFQVAASRSGLYFAFEVIDSDMVATVTRFDGPIDTEDSIELFITADDPVPDDPNVHQCRQLLFSPSGVRTDLTYLGGVSERKWTSDWRVAVSRHDKGFGAELFLPYYALEIVNAQCRRFHFNVARENSTGPSRELSVWCPTSRFIDQCHFGTLELPFHDFTAFHWRVNDLQLKSTPSANGTLQVLAGTVSSGSNGEISLQATARHDGKIVALNQCELRTDGRTAFQMPLNVGESGIYQVTVTGRTKDGKVLHHVQEIPMEAVAFKIKMNNPIYRRSFFPDQEDKTFSLTVDYQTDDGELLEKAKTQFSITGPDGGSVAFGERLSGRFRTFTADASRWQAGKYTITVQSTGHEALSGTLQETFQVHAPATEGNSVRLGRSREVYLNGKRFFPRGFLCGDNRKAEYFEEMSRAGYNVIHFYTLNQMKPERIQFILDEAQKHHLMVFCYPYYRCKVSSFGFQPLSTRRKSPRLTPQDWEGIREWVSQVKNHPAFLGWYLCDEPKGVEFCSELRRVYQTLAEIDPHHPVISLDMTADGCVGKRDGYADVHVLDMYPHPLVNGSWQRSVSSVLHSMKLVSDGVAPQGAWFCPEAFKPSGADYRSVTYREIRCIVFGSIVNGATGIVPYKIGNPKAEYYQNSNSGIFETPDMRLGYLQGVGPELRGLEAVLLEPERLSVATDRRHVIAMRKRHNGGEFVIAVNTVSDECEGGITGEKLPDGKYRVLGENREVDVRDGKLTDRFGGFETHIYTNDARYPVPVDIEALESEIAKAKADAKRP